MRERFLGFRKMRAMTRQQRSHSIEFKRQVVQEYIAVETFMGSPSGTISRAS